MSDVLGRAVSGAAHILEGHPRAEGPRENAAPPLRLMTSYQTENSGLSRDIQNAKFHLLVILVSLPGVITAKSFVDLLLY